MIVVCMIPPISVDPVVFSVDGTDRRFGQIHFGVKSFSSIVEPLFAQVLVLIVEIVLAVGQK